MKRMFIGILILAATSYSMLAQEHQITGGVGVLSTNYIADVFFNVSKNVINGLVGSEAKLENQKMIGEFRLGYAYYPTERLSVGATASILQTISDTVSNGATTGDLSTTYLTVAAESTLTYLSLKNIRLYGLLGAGITNMDSKYSGGSSNQSDGTTFFNFHVSPIGITFGNQFGGTAEIGFGYRGLFSFGVYYRL